MQFIRNEGKQRFVFMTYGRAVSSAQSADKQSSVFPNASSEYIIEAFGNIICITFYFRVTCDEMNAFEIMEHMKRRVSVVLVLLVFTAVCRGQETLTRGSLSGKVVDEENVPLPGAVVFVQSEMGVTRSVSTRSDGTFLIPFLEPGQYSLKVSAEGFTTEKRIFSISAGARTEFRVILLHVAPHCGIRVIPDTPIIDVHSFSRVSSSFILAQVNRFPIR